MGGGPDPPQYIFFKIAINYLIYDYFYHLENKRKKDTFISGGPILDFFLSPICKIFSKFWIDLPNKTPPLKQLII